MFRVQKVALQTLELSESLNWCIQVPTHCIISLADLGLFVIIASFISSAMSGGETPSILCGR